MEIVLVRHGRTESLAHSRIRGHELGEWARRYDAAGIDRTLGPPADLQARAHACGCILASDRRRSIESARWLASDGAIRIEPDLREAGLPDAVPIPLRLPAAVHLVIARTMWWLNWSRAAESVDATRDRADRVSEQLSALARDVESVIVVGHGMFNRFIAARLRKHGWRGPRALPSAYWSAASFFKSPDHQSPDHHIHRSEC